MQDNLEELLGVAQHAASVAAAVHRKALDGKVAVGTKSSPLDLVTAVDREAEQQLVITILDARPFDAILGEEGTDLPGTSGVRWVIDPLDGTTNFVYGYPAHAVAVGVEIDGKRVLGVVHDTYHDRVYSGIVGAGAQCAGKELKVRDDGTLSRALICTGFLPALNVRDLQGDVLRRLLPHVRDVRRSGCPSLDLCAVAAGTLDGYYESGLGRWDITAGAAIAEAAGATVIELHSDTLPDPLLVAANAQLIEALVKALAEAGAIEQPRIKN
ncbi:MAG TPA: inositol monophosphatase family protein [Pyrinomonadaceae bacterium]|nr:inositol monophosphatase family protein [Pyrinomonadaceae bacterium]